MANDIVALVTERRIKDEDGNVISAEPETVSAPAPSAPRAAPPFDHTQDSTNYTPLGAGLFQYHDPVTGKSHFVQQNTQPIWLKQSEQLVTAVKQQYGEPGICQDCHVNEVYSHTTCNTCNNAKFPTAYFADEFGRRFPI